MIDAFQQHGQHSELPNVKSGMDNREITALCCE
jgi:hypothetical protein